jgi:acyl-CoA thioesterase-1
MVGGVGGLTKAIEPLFKAEGARFVRDHEVSASVITVAQQPRLKELLQRHKPDLVILTLGANDVFVPFPDSMASSVEAIVKRIAPRACWWIGPPTWKPDTGIVRVIREHAGACHFFDSSNMKLERRGDGIHPTDKGGVVWGDRFWEAYKAGGQISPLVVDGGG